MTRTLDAMPLSELPSFRRRYARAAAMTALVAGTLAALASGTFG